MTKAELIVKGKSLGITLNQKMLKTDMEAEITKAEKSKPKEKVSKGRSSGEY